MIKILVLILVAIVIAQAVEILKSIKDWFKDKQWEDGKFGVIFATILGLIAGLSLQLGIVKSILDSFGVQYDLPTRFTYFDIGITCLFLSKGSGVFIDLIERFKQDSQEVKNVISDVPNIEFKEDIKGVASNAIRQANDQFDKNNLT